MLEGSRVVVVVPAFREALHVGRVVDTMPAFVDQVIVVDDGSDDRTSEAARAPGDPRVLVVRHPARRGVGAAIATGYSKALELTSSPTDAICVMAGDGQMHPDDLVTVATPIVRGDADYVKGDRFRDPAVRASMGLPRWIGGQVFSRLTSLAIGQPVSDSQCGFTALSRHAAVQIDIAGLWPSFGYPNDLLGQLAARKLRIVEVFVRPVYGGENSKLRLRHLPPIVFLIARAAARRRRAPPPVTRTDDTGKGALRNDAGVSS
jgi:glycosyltransferase involved in cell wall biosynthesis